jgi:hypothetical protein
VACEFPREANIIEEIYAFLREFALSFECALVLDPPTKLDVGSIALRNIAVATNMVASEAAAELSATTGTPNRSAITKIKCCDNNSWWYQI